MISIVNSDTKRPVILAKNENTCSFPDELVINIFSYLPPWDLISASQVCRQWHRCTEESNLWRPFLQKIAFVTKKKSDQPKVEDSEIRKTVLEHYKAQSNSDFFIDILWSHLIDFNEEPQQFLINYIRKYKEKIIISPNFLLSLKDVDLNSIKFKALDLLNIYIDLKEEELVFQWLILLAHIDDVDIIDGKQVIYRSLNNIVERILENKSFVLLAANIHKCCRLEFSDKFRIIECIVNRIRNLPWLQQYRIIATLKRNLPLDTGLTKKQYNEIAQLLVLGECETNETLPLIKYSERSQTSFKAAHYAFVFFKTSCLLVFGLASCALLYSFTAPSYMPLVLKVVVISGLSFITIRSVSQIVARYLSLSINELMFNSLKYIDESESYLAWKQKLEASGFLNPLIYKSCEQVNIPYVPLDNQQTSSNVLGVFYALHFAIDRLANEFQFEEKDKSNLLKAIKFLEDWHLDLQREIFVKQDAFYKNPAVFKARFRQGVATHRTQEALQTYQIKKRAREIGLVFPEVTPHILDYKEKIEAMANEIHRCEDITEWFQKLEEKNLLTDLLQLAQFNLPPNYRCVKTGDLLLSAVSMQGSFFNAENTGKSKIISKQVELVEFKVGSNMIDYRNAYKIEPETSSDIFLALIGVFVEYLNRNKLVNEEVPAQINDCLNFLHKQFHEKIDDDPLGTNHFDLLSPSRNVFDRRRNFFIDQSYYFKFCADYGLIKNKWKDEE